MPKVVDLIRKIYPYTVIIVDDYQYYYIYDRDAYIVYYLLDLSIKKYKDNKFIRNKIEYLNFLISKLKENQISYVVVVKRMGYNVDLEYEFTNENYIRYYNKGKLLYKRTDEINSIKAKLKVNIFDNVEKIKRIKRIVDVNVW